MDYRPLAKRPPVAEFRRRREQLLARLQPGALVILRGARPGRESRRFRQSNEFYYLTGLETPGAYAVIDSTGGETMLYLPHRDEKRERGEGRLLAAEDIDE